MCIAHDFAQGLRKKEYIYIYTPQPPRHIKQMTLTQFICGPAAFLFFVGVVCMLWWWWWCWLLKMLLVLLMSAEDAEKLVAAIWLTTTFVVADAVSPLSFVKRYGWQIFPFWNRILKNFKKVLFKLCYETKNIHFLFI